MAIRNKNYFTINDICPKHVCHNCVSLYSSCSLYSDIVYTLIKNILHNLKYFLKSSRFIAGDIEQKIVYTSIIHFHTN